MHRSFTREALTRVRDIPSAQALSLLATCCKADPTYVPVKDPRSRRWHVCTAGGDFEILTTGPKWFDTRAKKGGGGAIDLTMHLLQVPFAEAVTRLLELKHPTL